MKVLIRRYAILLALLLFWVPMPAAQTPPTIQKIAIRHVGPQATSDDLVRANIRVKTGDVYSRTSVDDDVRTLYATGYFYNISVGEEMTPTGVSLTYVLQGKPSLTEVQFSGNKKYSRAKLLKKVTSKTGEPLDERKLFNDTQEILKLYQKAGLQKTQVKYVLNIDENAGRGSVTFEIVESPRVKIEQVNFVGAQAFSQRKLRKVIKTRKRWMFSWLTGSGVLKDEQFEDDKEKLGEYYRNHGYIDYELKEVRFDAPKPKWMDINLLVSEGRQYKVGAVEFKGNKLFTADEIKQWIYNNKLWIGDDTRGKKAKRRGLQLNVGETFTPTGLSADLEAIQDFYGARGYIDTKIAAIKKPNTETGTMDLVYEIEEFDKSFIEKIEIKGNIKTKDRVIRRELAVSPGEIFDMVRVKLSKKRLEGLDYFEKIDAQPEPTEVPNRKNLVVGVEEKNTGNVMVGAGFSTVDNLVGFVELSQGNFDLFKPPYFQGDGQKFRIRAQFGTQRQDYLMTFIEPWFFGRKLAFQTDLYHRELNYLSDTYDERITGGRLGLTRALGGDFLIGGVSYTLENVGLVNVQPNAPAVVKQEIGNSLISKVGASLAYDTRNSSILPDRGQRTELLTEVAGGPLGGDKNFYKFELRSTWYFKGFAEGHIVEVTGRSGVAEQYGNTPYVPFYERYFLGGMYDLRGYKYRYVGPHDRPTGEPVGGNTYMFGSLEYSVPVVDRVRFAVFYDTGTVNPDAYNFSYKEYNDNWGLGLRINIPGMGPLRFDYGIPIRNGNNSRSGKFQFGVGYTREF